MEELNTECIGIDIGDTWCTIRGVDEVDGEIEVVRKERIETESEELRGEFGELEPTKIILEASTHSPWMSRLLADLGHDVHVVNPRRVQLISQNNYKDDETDAELLARLGRADVKLLSPLEHRAEQQQADLVKVRARAVLVRARSSLVTSVRGMVKSFGGRIPSCSTETFGKKAREHLPDSLEETLETVLSEIQNLTAKIRRLDREIEQLCEERYPETKELREIKGVGEVTALCFVLVLQDPARFETNRAAGAYIGLCPGRNQSGDSDPDCRITKAGDRYLRSLLVQSAQYIMHQGPSCDLRAHGHKLRERGGKYASQKAAVAVARKLAVLMLRLWRTGESYDPHYNARKRGEVVYPLEAAGAAE